LVMKELKPDLVPVVVGMSPPAHLHLREDFTVTELNNLGDRLCDINLASQTELMVVRF